MLTALLKLVPMLSYFCVGLLLFRSTIAQRRDGVFLSKLVLYVFMPALIIITISKTEMNGDRWLLPLANVVIDLVCLSVAIVYAKWRGVSRILTGNLVLGCGLINSIFVFPFALSFYGEAGLADALLFDFGNVIVLATVVYGLAHRYSGEATSAADMALIIVRSPVVIALFIALAISTLGFTLPSGVVRVLEPLGNMTMPVLFMSLGIMFSLPKVNFQIALAGVFIRMVGGVLAAMVIAFILGFEGDRYKVVVLMGAGPIAFSSVALSSIAKLDIEFASAMASLSVPIGIVTVPLTVLILDIMY